VRGGAGHEGQQVGLKSEGGVNWVGWPVIYVGLGVAIALRGLVVLDLFAYIGYIY
jgi:hypothetical protein